MRDGRLNIEDHLVDLGNRPIAASVNFEVRYSSPESAEGGFDSSTVSKFVQQQALEQGIDDEQQMLLDIEQNIANLEKSLNQGEDDFYEAYMEHKNNYKLLFHSLCLSVEAEHKKQNIFQRALGGGGGDKNYHSNSTKLKVRTKK